MNDAQTTNERKCVICGKVIYSRVYRDRVCADCADNLDIDRIPYRYHEIDPFIVENIQKNRKARRKRTCLDCGREFISRGPQNRICLVCKKKDIAIEDYTILK